jgi:hypothetical protein
MKGRDSVPGELKSRPPGKKDRSWRQISLAFLSKTALLSMFPQGAETGFSGSDLPNHKKLLENCLKQWPL